MNYKKGSFSFTNLIKSWNKKRFLCLLFNKTRLSLIPFLKWYYF